MWKYSLKKKNHFTLEPPSKATWDSHSEIILMLASSKQQAFMTRPSLVKPETGDFNLSWGRQIKKQHIYPTWTEKTPTIMIK